MPPSYRERLRIEGVALAGSGLVGALLLLAATAEAHRGLASSAIQLLVVAVLLLWLGPRSVRRAIAAAEPVFTPDLGSGEPTPLWQLPAIVIVLTILAGEVAGWDAGLRVSLGCVLVGLAQAFTLERIIALDEATSARRYLRTRGSRIVRGTNLGYTLRPEPLLGRVVIPEWDRGIAADPEAGSTAEDSAAAAESEPDATER